MATVNVQSPKFATVQNLEETKFETLSGPVTPAVTSPLTKKPPVLHTAQVVLSNDSQVRCGFEMTKTSQLMYK